MYSILLHLPLHELEQVSADLWELGTAGILEEEDGQWRAFFHDLPSIEALQLKRPALVFESREEAAAQAQPLVAVDDEPIVIGSRFIVTSSTRYQLDQSRLQLVVDSVTAFGTGRHESTQLVVELLETLVKAGDSIIDVGCGSGILSEAARLLAPVHVIACDIDESAIRAAQNQFEFPVFLGSVDALPSNSADLVLANISKKAVDALAPEIKRVLKATGHVVIGGFIRENVPARYRALREWQQGDWLCWLCTRDGILAEEQPVGQVLNHPLHWW